MGIIQTDAETKKRGTHGISSGEERIDDGSTAVKEVALLTCVCLVP